MVMRLLKPNKITILIFVLFIFIMLGGSMQTWVFSDKDKGVPKPFFYDLIEPFPLWEMWGFILTPIGLLSSLLFAISGNKLDIISQVPEWQLITYQLIYYYLISCLLGNATTFLWKKYKKKHSLIPF